MEAIRKKGHVGEQIKANRSKRSVGIPCGATISVVPRTSVLPRLVARITVGAMGDSSRELRYVKHSISSMWTWQV